MEIERNGTDPAGNQAQGRDVEADALDGQWTRREFLKTSALVGGTAAAASQVPWALQRGPGWTILGHASAQDAAAYPLNDPFNILHTSCLQCNTGCAIKVKLVDGVASKIDGNPFGPTNFWPHLPYETSPLETGTIDGWVCPKGQAGLQTTYDPYRIRKVLKRAGRRGEQKWESIPFAQAVEEIVEGGAFADGTNTVGLREIRALDDHDLSSEMATDVNAIIAQKDGPTKQAMVADFRRKHARNLDALIDPSHPDFGPKNNQFAFVWGRLKDGRGDLIKRFTGDAMGSVNGHGHTTVCQGSLYFTGKAMSEQFIEGKWTGGDKFYYQCDLAHTEFVVFVGANIFEANYGPPYRVQKVTEGLTEGRLRYVVIDPRLGKTGSKAWKWLPNRPGTEAAIAMAMIQRVVDTERYNAGYLENANKAAADADGEPNYCNATWLVTVGDDGSPGRLLRASDLGIEPEERPTADGQGTWLLDRFVVLRDGQPVAFDSNDTEAPVEGDLLVDTTLSAVGGDGAERRLPVKSVLQVLVDSANEHTLEEWAGIAGVRAQDLIEITDEFTRHGRRAAVDIHRGASQHTNGYYNVLAFYNLNQLIGNYDYAGGMTLAKSYDQSGTKEGQPYPIAKMAEGTLKKFGADIIRTQVKYESSTVFDGYPAKRPWYPLSTDIYQEIVPSIADEYPYPIRALFLYMGSPVYALPAGSTNIEALIDPARLSLFVCFDITVGETSMYADYIIPDVTYLERWEFQKSHPSVIAKNAPIRQPVVAPLTETVTAFGIEQPLGLESFLLAVAERMSLPGFGPDGFGKGKPFVRQEDLYLKQVANVAFGEKADGSDAVPAADDTEVELFVRSRRHLPTTVFDEAAWRAALADDTEWRRVAYVLNRGGRFQDFDKLVDGERLANRYGKYMNMYCEKTYEAKNSMTGEHFSGVARYFEPGVDATGTNVALADESEGYDLALITHRTMVQTKSRTIGNYWLTAIEPSNSITINSIDAARLSLRTGDRVRVLSKTNPDGVWDLGHLGTMPVVGNVQVMEGLRPGVVAFCLGFGHWAYGARDVLIDGEVVEGDARRATGVHANSVLRTDGHNPNTCLRDLVGGSAVFYDTRVKLVKE